MTKSLQGDPLQVWNPLLSHRQDFLENQLPQITITPKQQRIFELKVEVHARAGAQVMDTSSYELKDSDDNQFFWENPQLEVGAVFKLGTDVPCSPSLFDKFEMGRSSDNPIGLDED